jgi:hypothetical protein
MKVIVRDKWSHDDHDASDMKAYIQKLSTDLPDVLQAEFSKSYL